MGAISWAWHVDVSTDHYVVGIIPAVLLSHWITVDWTMKVCCVASGRHLRAVLVVMSFAFLFAWRRSWLRWGYCACSGWHCGWRHRGWWCCGWWCRGWWCRGLHWAVSGLVARMAKAWLHPVFSAIWPDMWAKPLVGATPWMWRVAVVERVHTVAHPGGPWRIDWTTVA
jgi:hypothetical protein